MHWIQISIFIFLFLANGTIAFLIYKFEQYTLTEEDVQEYFKGKGEISSVLWKLEKNYPKYRLQLNILYLIFVAISSFTLYPLLKFIGRLYISFLPNSELIYGNDRGALIISSLLMGSLFAAFWGGLIIGNIWPEKVHERRICYFVGITDKFPEQYGIKPMRTTPPLMLFVLVILTSVVTFLSMDFYTRIDDANLFENSFFGFQETCYDLNKIEVIYFSNHWVTPKGKSTEGLSLFMRFNNRKTWHSWDTATNTTNEKCKEIAALASKISGVKITQLEEFSYDYPPR